MSEKEKQNMEITILRRKRFYAFFMPTKISVCDKEGKQICQKRIWNGRTVNLQLPKQDYIVTFYNKILLSRNISTSVTIKGSVMEKSRIELEITHVHLLAGMIPLLPMLTPTFDYRATVMYNERLSMIHREKREKLSLLALPFLLMSLLCVGVIYSIWVDQPFAFDKVEIQQWALEGTDAYTKYTYELLGEMLGKALTIPILLLLCVLFYFLYRKINRYRQKRIYREADENAPAIIYLRSFKDDKLTAKEVDSFLRPGVSEEEALVSVLDDIAPVLGVGRPNEKYLPDGASCIVITDAQWREKVAELAQKAELVALRLGSTDGVLWELQYCLENLDLEKLLLILPNSRSASRPDDILDVLRQQGINLEGIYTGKRGRKGSIWGVLYFDGNNQPVCRSLQMPRWLPSLTPLEDKMRNALSGILARFGIKTQKRKSGPIIAIFCVMLLVFSIIISANTYLSFKIFEHDRFPHDLIEAAGEMDGVEEVIADWSDKASANYLFFLSLNGLAYQEEERIKMYYDWETGLMNRINSREFELLHESYDRYSIRMLTLMKKYCSEEGYQTYISFMTECVELFEHKKGEQPEFADGFEERALKAREKILPMIENIPLYGKDNRTWQEELEYERQFREVLQKLGNKGYDIMPEIYQELEQIRVAIYEEMVK